MIKKQFNKIFLVGLILILNLFITNKVFAVSMMFDLSKETVGQGEQFYVDLMLDPKGDSINAIEGQVSFPSDLMTLIRIEDGKSMVNLWVEKPKLVNSAVGFAGVISNGFDGVIDPFNPKVKLPGLILRLIFEAKSGAGEAIFSSSTFSLNKNDGLGTTIEVLPISASIMIGEYKNQSKYEVIDHGTPELEAYVIKNPDIFNNKYALIFKARDKETGIKSVKIKEGRRDWKEIESPYLLKDQSRHSTITIQATNFSGAGVSISIDKIPYDFKYFVKIISIIVGIIILFILIHRKRYVSKK